MSRLTFDDEPWIRREDKKENFDESDFLYLEDVYVN